MNRRIALRSGLLFGLLMVGVAASEAAGQSGTEFDPQVAAALRDLQNTVQRQTEAQNAHWRVVRQVQDQQRTFLKASHHYPEFVEVGPGRVLGDVTSTTRQASSTSRDASSPPSHVTITSG